MNTIEYWDNYFEYFSKKVEDSNKKNNRSKDRCVPDSIMIKYVNTLEILSKERFLDYGCSNCRLYPYVRNIFYKELNKKGKDAVNSVEWRGEGYYGIDISKVPLSVAVNYHPELKERLYVIEDNKIMFKDNFFDKILCFGVFDACEQDKVIYELLRVLNVNGKVIITGKNKDYFEDDEAARIAEINARKKGHPNYFTDFRSLLSQLERMNFVVENVDYFIRRGDFANNKFQKVLPEKFYEYAITIRKIETSKLDNFNRFSYEFSNTFKELENCNIDCLS